MVNNVDFVKVFQCAQGFTSVEPRPTSVKTLLSLEVVEKVTAGDE